MHTLINVRAGSVYTSLVLDWNGTPAEVTSYANYRGSVSFTVDKLGRSYVLTVAADVIYQARVCGDCKAIHDDNHAEAHLAWVETMEDEIRSEARYA